VIFQKKKKKEKTALSCSTLRKKPRNVAKKVCTLKYFNRKAIAFNYYTFLSLPVVLFFTFISYLHDDAGYRWRKLKLDHFRDFVTLINTTSAASTATSVPVPMAMPTWA